MFIFCRAINNCTTKHKYSVKFVFKVYPLCSSWKEKSKESWCSTIYIQNKQLKWMGKIVIDFDFIGFQYTYLRFIYNIKERKLETVTNVFYYKYICIASRSSINKYIKIFLSYLSRISPQTSINKLLHSWQTVMVTVKIYLW